jgi:hypothetical protein
MTGVDDAPIARKTICCSCAARDGSTLGLSTARQLSWQGYDFAACCGAQALLSTALLPSRPGLLGWPTVDRPLGSQHQQIVVALTQQRPRSWRLRALRHSWHSTCWNGIQTRLGSQEGLWTHEQSIPTVASGRHSVSASRRNWTLPATRAPLQQVVGLCNSTDAMQLNWSARQPVRVPAAGKTGSILDCVVQQVYAGLLLVPQPQLVCVLDTFGVPVNRQDRRVLSGRFCNLLAQC